MKFLVFIILFLNVSLFSFSQNSDFMVWTKIGAKAKIVKRLTFSGELNTRMGSKGIETFFPQAGFEYKVLKWLRPSIEYRFIVDKNKYGNYKSSNRLNFNVNLKKTVSNLGLGFRIRYQYAFNRLSSQSYNPDFDQAIRFKPVIDYKIENTMFTPFISSELFYDPQFGPNGPGFSKFRLGIGSKLKLKGPHSASFKYQLDKRFSNYKNGIRHVIAVGYSYKIK